MILPFALEHVSAAADLLVARHEEHRVAMPLLGSLDRVGAVAAVQTLLAVEGTTGVVAIEESQVVGYLLGTPKPGVAWGPNTWVEPAGCGGERLRELWAFAAAPWVAEGRSAQYALVPPSLTPEFFSLGFGLQHVHAAMPVPIPSPPDPRVRRATRADIPVLAQIDVSFHEHLVASPVFSGLTVTTYDAAVQEWEEDFGDPDYAVLVAEVEGVVVGSAIGCDVSKSSANAGLVSPSRAAHVAFAGVLPNARGLGLGTALAVAVEAWAHAEGYSVICTDWRAANVEADRTWTSRGYAQTFLRLHRLVGH